MLIVYQGIFKGIKLSVDVFTVEVIIVLAVAAVAWFVYGYVTRDKHRGDNDQ